MARKSGQKKEFVRLTPLQFSLSVSVVVILLGVAGLAGYYYGLNTARTSPAVPDRDARGPSDLEVGSQHGTAGTSSTVTFYSALTETRKEVPPAPRPEPVKKKAAPAEPAPAADAPPPPTVEGTPDSRGGLMVQVASYQDQTKARKQLQELSSGGYAGTVLRADLDQRGVWYRVQLGPYRTEEDARQVLETLKRDKKLKGYVVK